MQRKNHIRYTSVIILMFIMYSLLSMGCSRIMSQPSAQKPQAVHPKDTKREVILSKALNVVVIYFATPDNKNLVPITLDVNPTEQMAKVATEKLLAGPSSDTLSSTIPEGTKLKDLYKFDNIAYVDLTQEFLKADTNEKADIAVQALVMTLTEFSQVSSVQILIDGKVPVKKYGSYDISKTLERPADINFYGKKGKNLYKVYYSDSNAMYIVPVTFSSNREITPGFVVEQLLKEPPKDSELIPSIWPGTKLLGIQAKDETAFVDLSQEVIAYGGGSAAESNLVTALTYTLTELPGIKKVQLLIEGKKPDFLPEGTDTSLPWERPGKINYLQK